MRRYAAVDLVLLLEHDDRNLSVYKGIGFQWWEQMVICWTDRVLS